MNPDLVEERKKCNFNQDEMCFFLYGAERIAFWKKMQIITKKYPELNTDIKYYEMSREEQMRVWWRRYRLMMETEELRPLLTQYSSNQSYGWWMSYFPGVSPLSLHMIAF